MSLSSKDIVVTFVAFGVIGASSFALYRDFVATSSVSQEKIGTITYKKKKAERKFSSRATWEGLSQSSPVYNHDSIKTAESASATINLNDGTVLDLDENTLVVLAINKGEAAVDVGSGSLFANGQGSSALTVRAKGNTITTKKGSLSLSLDKDDVKLRMVSGGASVAATGGTQTVSGDEALHLSGG
ncbi:MAG TPA: FecR domain-containing protein, partial [Spirochaetota bacterium]